MSPTAERIYQHIKEFSIQRDTIRIRIKQLENELASAKQKLHKEETKTILHVTDQNGHPSPDIQFVKDIREITKLRQDIKTKINEQQERYLELSELIKKIDHYTFWMHRADTSDLKLQKEAEKVIFG